MAGALAGTCSYTGWGSSITGVLCNAASGNLSADQVAELKRNAEQQIRQASAGMQPTAQDVLVQQGLSEIDRALATFAMPGETGVDVGAIPGQAGFRLPGAGVVTLPKLNTFVWWLIAAGLIAGAFFAFPYLAPGIARNIKAARLLRG